ncbi:glycosyl hydrolase [Rhizosphaericola mali]|uniref:DNA-binding protein n=1 Tax=Rhizosphaericola mali TaxID=2545455 RepID=A0A5P2FZF6_9BACT|nr:glycosyl hydrolase [Rhizosphaericola mali]QES88595.1 DNA-binding protein [Rhizosphaericola mali]
MERKFIHIFLAIFFCFALNAIGQKIVPMDALEKDFKNPTKQAGPWVFWYWMQAAVSKEGIAADIKAMKAANIAGAYLMTIKGEANPSLYNPSAPQLSPKWWELVKYAMEQAKINGIDIAMHDCDGFALAGGPWITEDKSMQKVVWSDTVLHGNADFESVLPVPIHYKNYYKDIAVYAFPVKDVHSSYDKKLKVTSNVDTSDLSFLNQKGNKKNFTSKENGWIQYTFEEPFTAKSLVVRTNSNNYQAHRLTIEFSEDGIHFSIIRKLIPARHGWQDTDADYTFSLPETKAKYFRFLYDPIGSEPGAEDLDAAKWKQSLKLSGLELSSEAKIDQYESKNGSVWRVAQRTENNILSKDDIISSEKMMDLTKYLDANGKLNWKVPAGQWKILRIGHTSTGHTNATGGNGSGLECDKFDSTVVAFQYGQWYGEIIKHIGPELSKDVLTGFHVDSWECGSQNWSPRFADEFKKRRGYDPVPFLLIMAGYPLNSVDSSERFLYDIRQTIAELINDVFFKTMAKLAHKDGKVFSAESVAPVMVSDGLRHYAEVDVPMGEFWLNSPTHDKPNDMMDAVSGAHIYGKNIIQAEGFTELKMYWDEHPTMLKGLLDRNYALGMNKLVFHVFMHNPWIDRRPGMTLDGVGLYFQRDQTWWPQAKGFTDYISRSQSLLQKGHPVVDIAIFTGEELPSRSLLPDRIIDDMPGLFGEKQVNTELERKRNIGLPLATMPKGVTSSANIPSWEKWINPLRGYQYDAINKDALLRLAKVDNGHIILPGGASYSVLVIPDSNALNPNRRLMSAELVTKLYQLVKEGATVFIGEKLLQALSLSNKVEGDRLVEETSNKLWNENNKKVFSLPIKQSTLDYIGLERDAIFFSENNNDYDEKIAFAHRKGKEFDVYFISNQDSLDKELTISLRVSGKVPEYFNALTGEIEQVSDWYTEKGRTIIKSFFSKNESKFIVFINTTTLKSKKNSSSNWKKVYSFDGSWNLKFDEQNGGPKNIVTFPKLESWTNNKDSSIRFYSGEVAYQKEFYLKDDFTNAWLYLGKVANVASVEVNGKDCGIAWTFPYRVNLKNYLKKGKNIVVVKVANTWHNRIMQDQRLPVNDRLTWTTSPIQLAGDTLLDAGLMGPVYIEQEVKNK